MSDSSSTPTLAEIVRTMKRPRTVKARDLQIGDVIRFAGIEAFADCTVYQVKDGRVYLVRPYVHASDFIHTGGVITYIGQEKFDIDADDAAILLLRSQDPEETRKKIRAIVDDIRSDVLALRISAALEKLRQL